jgi:hypothetical protein
MGSCSSHKSTKSATTDDRELVSINGFDPFSHELIHSFSCNKNEFVRNMIYLFRKGLAEKMPHVFRIKVITKNGERNLVRVHKWEKKSVAELMDFYEQTGHLDLELGG